MLIPLEMVEWCIPLWVTLTLTLTSDLISRFSCLKHISYITANFPQMCLMLDQFLWGHLSRDYDISCLSPCTVFPLYSHHILDQSSVNYIHSENIDVYLSYDVASGSEITPCNKIDKPLVVYRFTGNVMTSITTLHT